MATTHMFAKMDLIAVLALLVALQWKPLDCSVMSAR
jgi:hypothetical protein